MQLAALFGFSPNYLFLSAKSVSCILPRADDRLTDILSRFAIVDDSLLDNAPSSPRRVDINEIAASIVDTAAPAFVPALPRHLHLHIAEASKSLNVTDIVSPLPVPIWKTVTAVLVPKFTPANVVLSAIDLISVSNAL